MSKKLLLSLCAITLFFGCKKKDTTESTGYYAVSGIHDVTCDTVNYRMDISILYPSAYLPHEEVRISATGLPSGITASLNPATGMPPFLCAASFRNEYTSDIHGTFPFKIITSSNSGQKEHDVRITVPELNGVVYDQNRWQVATMNATPGNSVYASSIYAESAPVNQFGGTWLEITFNRNYPLPTTDGTYRVMAAPDVTADNQVSIAQGFAGSPYAISEDGNSTIQIRFVNGKMKISGYNLRLKSTVSSSTAPFALNFTAP